MKKIILILSVLSISAFISVSCNQKKATDVLSLPATTIDTTGFAQFQQWKALNERLDPNLYYQANETSPPLAQQKKPATNYRSGAMNSSSSYQAKAPARKKWSKAAKGTVIGSVAGGTLGAIIAKKNRVAGAIIGLVLGGGAGYEIGRSQDKKDGRY